MDSLGNLDGMESDLFSYAFELLSEQDLPCGDRALLAKALQLAMEELADC